MNHQPPLPFASPTAENLQGSIERITFHNADNGFCVLRVAVKGERELITVVGTIAQVTAGEYLEARGHWVNSSQYGVQFNAETLRNVPPNTLEGMEKYLGSGLIRGIGAHFAKKLIKAFGTDIFTIIETTPDRLQELRGIGKKRCQQITNAWAEQKVVREIMVFLQSHGIGTARATRIYKTYGDNAINQVMENPYRLALDIKGIGFKTADTLAQRLNIPNDSPQRAQAGIRHVLQNLSEEGHCASTYNQLVAKTAELLGISEQIVKTALEVEIHAETVIAETIQQENCIFLTPLYRAEVGIANHLKRLMKHKPCWSSVDLNKSLHGITQKTGMALSNSQKEAIETVLEQKVTIITGGPGVGKTTLIKSLLLILQTQTLQILLCAPTGRAAKRLSESTGLPAVTIHRLLEFSAETGGFKRNAQNLLETDLLIVDETSMVDVVLMNQLLRAIPDKAGLLLVGDVDQLPSVGAGTVLADLIASATIPTVKLTEIFRQAKTSQIIVNAHRINQGWMPEYPKKKADNSVHESPVGYGDIQKQDFYLIPAETPEEILQKLLHVVTERIPQRFGFDAIRDVQVLTPMQRGGLGARSLNSLLQQQLNPTSEPRIERFGWTFAVGDKVIQTVNNYDKEVFNGDIGVIQTIDLLEQIAILNFDNKPVTYEFGELDEIALAYATTVHKAQGSEYPVVVIPLAMQHFMLLERNLLYTAVTRGKSLVVIIGQVKALGMAVHTNQAVKRLTNLAARLRN